MPVLHARRNPNYVTSMDLLGRSAPVLDQALAGCDDQGLADRMRMPAGAGALMVLLLFDR